MSEPLIRITGLDEALKKLKNADPRYKRKVFGSAARSAMIPVRNAVRNAAKQIDNQQTSRSIAKNVAIRTMPKKKLRVYGASAADFGVSVGILGGARTYADSQENRRKRLSGKVYSTEGDKTNPGGDTWYWRLVEFGRSSFSTGVSSITGKRINLFNPGTGKNFGYKVDGVTAKPFMQPALPANISTVVNILTKRINEIIKKSA